MSFDELDALRYWQAHGPARPMRFGDCDQPYVPPDDLVTTPGSTFHILLAGEDPSMPVLDNFPWLEDHSESYTDQAGHIWYTRSDNGRRLRVPTRAGWVDRRRGLHLRLILADPTFGDPCKLCRKHLKGRGLVHLDWHLGNVTARVRRGTRYGARMHLYRVHGVGRPL